MLSASCWPAGHSTLGRDPHFISTHAQCVDSCLCGSMCWKLGCHSVPFLFPVWKLTWVTNSAWITSILWFSTAVCLWSEATESPAALNPQSPYPVRHLWRHPAAQKHPNNFWALIIYNWAQWAQKRLLFSAERTEKWCVWLRAPVAPHCTSPPWLPPVPEWHFGFQESTHRARLRECWAGAGTPLSAGAGLCSARTNTCSHWSALGELPLHGALARSDVPQAFPPYNHQFHLQFFNKLLNYTSLNDTLQIQQVLIANDGSERLSFDCN